MCRIALVVLAFGIGHSGLAEEKKPGFDSPEKAFRAYLAGAVSQDFDLILSSLTPESKAYHIGLAVVSVPYLFDEKETQKLFAEHEVGTSEVAIEDKGESEEELQEKAYVDIMLKVKNPSKLMGRIAERTDQAAKQLAKSVEAPKESKTPTQQELLSSVTLGKVTITEEKAVATATVEEPAKSAISTFPENIPFRRINGRWYCDIDPR